MMIFQNWIMYM